MLGQAGLFVPAAQARLPWHDGLFASLAITPEAEQREGRLGTELLRIRRMFEKLEIGALVLECTNMPPYRADIQHATGLPVFDITTLVTMVHDAVRDGLPPRPA